MTRWQLRERVRLQDRLDEEQEEADAAGTDEEAPALTLAQAAEAYLQTVTSMPSYESRTHDLNAWVKALGPRRIDALLADDFARTWDGWRKAGRAVNTLNHRRTALLSAAA
jgi:predicted ATPase